MGTLINPTNAFRSNEAIGDIGTIANPGATGPVMFTNFDTFAPAAVPEPGGMVPMLLGTVFLGGVIVARRRRGLAT